MAGCRIGDPPGRRIGMAAIPYAILSDGSARSATG